MRRCDLWFPPKKIPLEDGSKTLLPVMVITAAHSRFLVGQMIPTRHTADLLLGMWELLQQLGRVPRRLIWDNESGIGRGKRHAEGVGAFTGTLTTTLQRLKPYDPESKGIVERRRTSRIDGELGPGLLWTTERIAWDDGPRLPRSRLAHQVHVTIPNGGDGSDLRPR